MKIKTVLLKHTLRFEATYAAAITDFVGVFFVMLLKTGVQIPESLLATMVAFLMGAYTTDTFEFNGTVIRDLATACSDRFPTTRHETAHLLVSQLLGFCVDDYELPLPMGTFRTVRGDALSPSVRLGSRWRKVTHASLRPRGSPEWRWSNSSTARCTAPNRIWPRCFAACERHSKRWAHSVVCFFPSLTFFALDCALVRRTSAPKSCTSLHSEINPAPNNNA